MIWAVALIMILGFSVIAMLLFKMVAVIQESHKQLTQGLGSSSGLVAGVQEKLGRLEETNRRIVEISKDISSLQELLRAPKFRGAMGESLLENLLSQVLPSDHYQMQYHFLSGEAVDAIIRLGERILPIDAKFSYDNFRRMVESTDEDQRSLYRKKFSQDIKARVDEIASKYILPGENTFDFAFMYVPAENVYYEVATNSDLFSYFISRKVIPVSPNSFYAYLQVICLGLKGLKVEENAKQILKSLGAMQVDLNRFREEFDTLGRHLTNANLKYTDSSKRLDKISERLGTIQETKQIE